MKWLWTIVYVEAAVSHIISPVTFLHLQIVNFHVSIQSYNTCMAIGHGMLHSQLLNLIRVVGQPDLSSSA
jgi:hypothetical protein